jgi:G3E family GTPase
MGDSMKPDLYLINGPLGAGKTTFLKELLKLPQYNDARIIENEFANTSVDTEQLHDHHAEVQTIAGVCICCSTGDELTDALGALAKSNAAPVVIEATGIANSLKLIEKIVNADMLDVYTIKHAVFILDAIEASDDIEATLETYRHELQAADTVLVSKTDLLSTDQSDILMEALSELELQQVSFVREGKFDPALLTAESHILEYFAQLDEHIDNHEDGASYTVIDTSDVHLEALQLAAAWQCIQADYGIRRMKGNVKQADDTQWHIEATPHQCKVSPYESGALRLVVIGQDATSVTLQSVLEVVNRG